MVLQLSVAYHESGCFGKAEPMRQAASTPANTSICLRNIFSRHMEGDALLLELLSEGSTPTAKAEALQALWRSAHPQLVKAIYILATAPEPLPALPLDGLYAMARNLPIASLLRCFAPNLRPVHTPPTE